MAVVVALGLSSCNRGSSAPDGGEDAAVAVIDICDAFTEVAAPCPLPSSIVVRQEAHIHARAEQRLSARSARRSRRRQQQREPRMPRPDRVDQRRGCGHFAKRHRVQPHAWRTHHGAQAESLREPLPVTPIAQSAP